MVSLSRVDSSSSNISSTHSFSGIMPSKNGRWKHIALASLGLIQSANAWSFWKEKEPEFNYLPYVGVAVATVLAVAFLWRSKSQDTPPLNAPLPVPEREVQQRESTPQEFLQKFGASMELYANPQHPCRLYINWGRKKILDEDLHTKIEQYTQDQLMAIMAFIENTHELSAKLNREIAETGLDLESLARESQSGSRRRGHQQRRFVPPLKRDIRYAFQVCAWRREIFDGFLKASAKAVRLPHSPISTFYTGMMSSWRNEWIETLKNNPIIMVKVITDLVLRVKKPIERKGLSAGETETHKNEIVIPYLETFVREGWLSVPAAPGSSSVAVPSSGEHKRRESKELALVDKA